MMQAINRHKPEEFDPKQKSSHWGKTQACEGPMKDAFDLWWEWAEKPHESLLMIDADLHRPIMELSPEDRREGQRSWASVPLEHLNET